MTAKAAARAFAALGLLVSTGAAAHDLERCARQSYDAAGLLQVGNYCRGLNHVQYVLRSDIGNPAKVVSSAGWGDERHPSHTRVQVERAGGIVIAVCADRSRAFERDGRTPWSGRPGGYVCRDAKP